MIVIDGTNQILGRVASYAARKALQGEKVAVVNCENIIITGKKEFLVKKFKTRLELGDPHKGPYYPRAPDRIMRRTVRGMLPFARPRGQEAYRRVMCYLGVPQTIKEKPVSVKGAGMEKLQTLNYMTLQKLSAHISK